MLVGLRQTLHFFRRHVEAAVLHPERTEKAFVEKRAERLARHTLDQRAEHVGADAVGVGIARLMFQRQFADLREEIAETRTAPKVRALIELCDFIAAGEVVDQTARVREQMLDRHRAFQRLQLRRVGGAAGHHLHVLQRGQMFGHRIIEVEPALFE